MHKLITICGLLLVNSLMAQDQEVYTLFKLEVHERNDTLALSNMEFYIEDLNTHYNFSVFADSNGLALAKVPRNHRYAIFSSDPNIDIEYYNSKTDTILADSLVKIVKLEADLMEMDFIITFPTIYFDKNSSELTDTEKHKVDSFVVFISKYPRLIFELVGHANEFKSSEKNYQLSEVRARKVLRQIESNQFAQRNYYFMKPMAEFGPNCPCTYIPKGYPTCSHVDIHFIGRIKK